MRTAPRAVLSAAAFALALAACGDYSRAESSGDDEAPAVVPDREGEEAEGLASPETPAIHDPAEDEEDRDGDRLADGEERREP